MTAMDLIKVVGDHGGQISLRDGDVRLTAKTPLPDALVQKLKEAKPEIVSYLRRVENVICGQCAVAIGDAESLHTMAGGEPGQIHIRCYYAWYDANIRGRHSD